MLNPGYPWWLTAAVVVVLAALLWYFLGGVGAIVASDAAGGRRGPRPSRDAGRDGALLGADRADRAAAFASSRADRGHQPRDNARAHGPSHDRPTHLPDDLPHACGIVLAHAIRFGVRAPGEADAALIHALGHP